MTLQWLWFRTCLGTLGVSLTEQETQELINRYRVGNAGLINYRDFVDKLDTVFGDQVDTSSVIQNARTTAVSYKNHFVKFLA